MHANHALHPVAATWLASRLERDELWVTHHAVLECYAVLTRLPGGLRVTGDEAKRLLDETVRRNMRLASYEPETIWQTLDELAERHVMGGSSYDAFQAFIHRRNGVGTLATFDPRHYRHVAPDMSLVDPSNPGDTDDD